MKKPLPVLKESPFGMEELFFSTTDSKGTITFGNDVFLRVSAYPTEGILGAPHNIIRHPDMPKAVFKVFWDMLKSKKSVGAYVKNMAADGSYYWVFAFAFPVEEGYLSIRFKPSSPLFLRIDTIYKSVLTKEKATNMDESFIFLQKCIKEEGFESYEDFMVAAAVEELSSREKLLNNSQNHTEGGGEISIISKITSQKLNQSFTKVDNFKSAIRAFSESISTLRQAFNELKFVSVNMKILAGKYGDRASTLEVIAHQFSTLADEIELELTSFSNFIVKLTQVVKKSTQNLAELKIQVSMVEFFVIESLAKSHGSENAFSGMIKNRNGFTRLFKHSSFQLLNELTELKANTHTVKIKIEEIHKFISGLEIIKLIGAIETARDEEVRESFLTYLKDMTTFIALLSKTMGNLNIERENLLESTKNVGESLNSVSENVDTIFSLAMKP